MGYLDNAGLSRFTAWVRGWLAEKLDKTGGETKEFLLSVPADEFTAETCVSIYPEHLDVAFFGVEKSVTITANEYGVTFNGDPFLTEQTLNSALETELTPVREELAGKVSAEEFQSAMADGPWLPLSGGSMRGPLSVQMPTADSYAANKGYVDRTIRSALSDIYSSCNESSVHVTLSSGSALFVLAGSPSKIILGNFAVGMAELDVEELQPYNGMLKGSIRFSDLFTYDVYPDPLYMGFCVLKHNRGIDFSFLTYGSQGFDFSLTLPSELDSASLYICAFGEYY